MYLGWGGSVGAYGLEVNTTTVKNSKIKKIKKIIKCAYKKYVG